MFCAVGGFGGGASIRWTRRLRDLCLRCVCGLRAARGAGGLRGALSSAVGFAPRLKCIWHKHIN